MYGYESWTIKKAECQRIDTFKLCCWRRLLRVPWMVRRSNQSILREIHPEYSLEGLVLKLQYFGHLMQRATHWKTLWCWERSKAGGEGDDRGWSGWMVSPTQWTWVWASSGGWWKTGKPGVLQSIGWQEVDMNERLNNNRSHKDIQQSPRMRASWKEDLEKPTKVWSTEVSLFVMMLSFGEGKTSFYRDLVAIVSDFIFCSKNNGLLQNHCRQWLQSWN